MITVRNLTKIYKTALKNKGVKGTLAYIFKRQYKQVKAVDNISFHIGRGELIGFIGPNGAGKTTTIKMLSGLLYPTAGYVKVAGFIPFKRKKEFLKKISFFMGQKNQLFWELPAYDSFLANKEIYEVEEAKFKRQLDYLIELLDVADLVNQPVKTLSLGERMKMELIANLIYEPEILFLDEPTIGLDVISQKAIRDFIKRYRQEKQATVILTSHYLQDVVYLANRLIMINKGKIIYNGSVEAINQQYSKNKIVKVVLRKNVDSSFLKKIDPNFEYDYPLATFKIAKKDLANKIGQITERLDFADINIDDIPIEEIVSAWWKDSSRQ